MKPEEKLKKIEEICSKLFEDVLSFMASSTPGFQGAVLLAMTYAEAVDKIEAVLAE